LGAGALQIQSEFVVQAPIAHVWNYLLDVERVAPCMPGAELTEVVDERTWKGKTNIKVGPVALSFAGTVVLQERDDVAHRVVLKAQGMEQRGKGAASALATSQLQAVEGGTKVVLDTDLTISGAVAQYGRGMILDISQRLTKQFAQCLENNIKAEAATASASTASSAPEQPGHGTSGQQAAAPVRGFRLALWALWRAVVRFFRRLLGRPSG
jgi:carbon monoxide dehydrogenase subunit G